MTSALFPIFPIRASLKETEYCRPVNDGKPIVRVHSFERQYCVRLKNLTILALCARFHTELLRLAIFSCYANRIRKSKGHEEGRFEKEPGHHTDGFECRLRLVSLPFLPSLQG